MVHRNSALALAPLVARYALAQEQQYSISTTEFTTCGPVPTEEPPKKGDDGIITVIMPACPDCKCDCSHTKTYTTVYETLCPTGVTEVTHTVAEVYKGVSTAPVVVSTEVPHGFTTTVAVCNVCGPDTVTKTLTVPVTPKETGGQQPGGQQPGGQQPGGQQPGGQQPGGQQPGGQQPGGQQPGGQQPGCPGGPNCPGGNNNGTNPNPPVVGGSSKLQTFGGLLAAAAAAAIL